jgi:hypothetical protein
MITESHIQKGLLEDNVARCDNIRCTYSWNISNAKRIARAVIQRRALERKCKEKRPTGHPRKR